MAQHDRAAGKVSGDLRDDSNDVALGLDVPNLEREARALPAVLGPGADRGGAAMRTVLVAHLALGVEAAGDARAVLAGSGVEIVADGIGKRPAHGLVLFIARDGR